ncbi:MAG: GTPase ObgE [Deltaproteobacteria bacterium]|nr:GTPase ObgE [Deltaproteobacteria bacterium]
MKFIDEARIVAHSGSGGNGSASFRREKYVPKGGPDGGNGGRGGDVIFRADASLKTLLDYHYRRQYKAGNGGHGEGGKRSGKTGADIVLKVPVGTEVKDGEGNLLCDLASGGMEFAALKGGRGGRGNACFATPWRQAPDYAEEGKKGEEAEFVLNLKLLADVGIIGLPNAGKSTLINRISACRAKVADYPFTTLTPNLGVVKVSDDETFVVADCPGIIKDAHRGIGLGVKFLKHIERTRVIVHLVDASTEDYDAALGTVEEELRGYNPEVIERPTIQCLCKIDLVQDRTRIENFLAGKKDKRVTRHAISSLTGAGIEELVYKIAELLKLTQPHFQNHRTESRAGGVFGERIDDERH